MSATHGPDTFLRVDAPNTTVYGGKLTLTVANRGGGPTDGSTVTVTDTLPAGLAALVNNPGFGAGPVAASGAGWTCTGAATLSCTRGDVLAAGAAYPPITITVRVTNNAAALLTNSASVAGGGSVAPSSSLDRIPVGTDACPNGWAAAKEVVFSPPSGGIRSGVSNPERADGCTLLDAIWAGEPFANHGAFVAHVDTVTDRFVAAGLLTPAEKGKVRSAAARSQVGTASDHQVDNSCQNRVAIKLDDGPSGYRPQTLRLFRDKQVHATMFDLGVRIDDNPAVAAFAAREGHVVLNHTYWHPHLDALFDANPRLVEDEVRAADAAMRRAGSRFTLRGVRPPFGEANTGVTRTLASLGYTVYTSSMISSIDYEPTTTPDYIVNDIVGRLRPGVIFTLHDGPIDTTAGANVLAALGPIIDQARALGYCFGVLDDKGNVTADRYVSSGKAIPQITRPVSYLPLVSEGTPPAPWHPTPQPLEISASHRPDAFAPGQVGNTLTLTVRNVSAAPTDGSTITVTDQLPTGLVATSASGAGWTCTGTATRTCTRADVLPAHASYPPITVTVDVTATAPAAITNSPTVTGHGGNVWVDTTSDVIDVG
ncbi:polysaccharide deacetylase family protein [Micromonospora sp. NPDC049559]|uniref:polysaccharide deacetylase family protein n=1 Tax=Micromonospora sp. NPDC049559 TaxID=3155923 RepID=UPI00343665CA